MKKFILTTLSIGSAYTSLTCGWIPQVSALYSGPLKINVRCSMLRIRHFLAFYLLTFLLLGLVPLFSLVFNDRSMDFSRAAKEATASAGIEWTSNILSVIRLSAAEPILLLTLLGSSVPALAALSMLAFHRNRRLWKRFAFRLMPFQHGGARDAALLYLGIFVLMIPVLLIAYIIRTTIGASYQSNFSFGSAMLTSILARQPVTPLAFASPAPEHPGRLTRCFITKRVNND